MNDSQRSGYTVTTTCSPRNFAYVKELGADSVFDYHDTGAAARIREQTGNKLKYAWDTISDSASAQFCAQALSTESGCRYGTILPVPSPRDDVRSVSTFMYTVFGEEFDLNGTKIAAVPEDFEFAKKFMALTETLLAEGKLRPHAHTLGQGGLEGVLQGLDELQNGRVSGSKLVYRLE